MAADYWYSAAHYVVIVVVLVWLYRRSRDTYLPARRALALATVLGCRSTAANAIVRSTA